MGMRKVLTAVALLVLGSVGRASAYEFVRVVSGREIQVTNNGQPLSLIVSGITVPTPPTAGDFGEYRGADARDFLNDVVRNQPAFIKEIEPLRPGAKTLRVRIHVGPEGERDLAVLMAEAGLALVDKPAKDAPEFLASVRDGERAARIAHRGMHDGGYQAFMSSKGHVVELGVGTLSGDSPEAGYQAYLEDLARGGGQAATSMGAGRSNRPTTSPIHSSGSAAIRDYGSRMGLPPDSSSWGN